MQNRVSSNETTTVQTVDRAIDVLGYVITNAHGPTLSDISQGLALSKSTVHRLLSCLRSRGVLERDSASRYRAGPLFFQWCSCLSSHGGLASLVLPFLQQLRDETGETASFHLAASTQQVCIEQAVSRHDLRYVMRTGQPTSLRVAAAGKVILAHLSEGERQQILSSENDQGTTPADLEALDAELSAIRSRGIAYSVGEIVKGINGVSAPVFNDCGKVMASVTLSGPASRLALKVLQTYAPGLKEVATRISRELGYRVGGPVSSRRTPSRS